MGLPPGLAVSRKSPSRCPRGKNRVLRLMRKAGLLAPQRVARRRRPRVHDGRVITDAPNVRWGTDATMAWTRNDGWVWVFALLDHHTDEAWAHVAKVGNRFAALQPVYDAVIDRFGGLGPDVARGSSSATTGAANIGPTISRARSTGWGSKTMPALSATGVTVTLWSDKIVSGGKTSPVRRACLMPASNKGLGVRRDSGSTGPKLRGLVKQFKRTTVLTLSVRPKDQSL